MKVTRIRKAVVLAVVASSLALGCELIVDFDRNLIPVEDIDATPNLDGSLDGPIDTGFDAPILPTGDADAEASSEGGSDADADSD